MITITANEMKKQTNNDKLEKIRKEYERSIQNAAKYGNHYCILNFVDCTTGNDRIIFEELEKQGFQIYQGRTYSEQALAYYALW